MPHFIPQSDVDFDAWQKVWTLYALAHAAELGLTPEHVAALSEATAKFRTAMEANDVAHATAEAATQAKDAAREGLEVLLRQHSATVQANRVLSDDHRKGLGLPVHKKTRTAVPAPTTRPVLSVDSRERLRHLMSWFDEATPGTRAKPKGVHGCELWWKKGDPGPASPDDFVFLVLDTATPYLFEFDPADAGKRVYYLARWVNRAGEHGPWSEMVSAVVMP